MKFLKFFYLPLFFCFLFSLMFVKPAFAEDFPDLSEVDCSVYATNSSLWDAAVNQQRFAQDMVTSLITGPLMTATAGANFEQLCQCAKDTQLAKAATGDYAPEDVSGCTEVKTFLATGGVFTSAKYAFDVTAASGDFVSVKYYANDLFKKSPFAKTGYAATGDPSPLPAILDIWKNTRNVSYVLFTVIFIVIGFMIMFRKRIDPQTVVTVQNALPRVVLSLILITFSYPIVSIIFSLSSPLSGTAHNLVDPLSGWSIANLILRIILSVVLGILGGSAVGSPLLGLAIGLLLGILFVALIIGFVIYCLTFVTRLGKVAMLTALAPFILLMGTLPGNEKTILNWFKNILSVTLQIPALVFVLWFGVKVASVMAPVGTPLGIVLVSLVLNPLIGTYILFQAGKVPKMLDAAIGVEPMLFGDSGGKKR